MEAIVAISRVKSSELGAVTQCGSHTPYQWLCEF